MKHPGKLTIEDDNSVSDSNDRFVPGWPGIPARWTSSAKSGVAQR